MKHANPCQSCMLGHFWYQRFCQAFYRPGSSAQGGRRRALGYQIVHRALVETLARRALWNQIRPIDHLESCHPLPNHRVSLLLLLASWNWRILCPPSESSPAEDATLPQPRWWRISLVESLDSCAGSCRRLLLQPRHLHRVLMLQG